MAEVTPPPLQVPTSKERRYDRQLRLWAANGQAALEEAHILLVNSGPGVVGVETLKNLVLPGIGQYTILDPALVTEADLGVNFFVEDGDLGASRAERTSKWLDELNPDVIGHHISESFETFFSRPNALEPYTLILIILPTKPEILEQISAYSQSSGIPAFYIHSVGSYSHFTVQLPSAFPIVDTHPDPATTTDLRLLDAWPALNEKMTAETRGLETMDDEEHGHVPYVLLLLHYLKQWRDSHDGLAPQNYKEKSEFREIVRSGTRTNNPEGGEENFEEAVSAVLKSLNPSQPSGAVKEAFSAAECQNLTGDSTDFWIIANAIHQFYLQHGALPLPGSLPDMKARSADYIELQNIYKTKARSDVADVTDKVHSLLTQLGITRPVDPKEVEAFCKSAGYVKLVRGRAPIFVGGGGVVKFQDRAKFAANALNDPTSLIQLYICFLAYDSYVAKHSTTALNDASHDTSSLNFEDREAVISDITAAAQEISESLILEADTSLEEPERTALKVSIHKLVTDLVNAQGGELHNVAAVTGGMVAQEVIKAVTKQYVPVDNTCLFDGVKSRASVLRL